MNKTALLVFVAALALAGGLLAALVRDDPRVTIESGTLLETPRPLPAFELTDAHGRPFGNRELLGQWTLVFPGFTYCPDICPTTLALLREVEQALGEPAQQLQVLLFSVDPERDTPDTLRRYVEHFSPRFRAATAPEPALGAMAQALGIAYVKVPGDTADSYTMDHSSALILIDPQGRIAGYLTPPHRLETLTADLRRLLEAHS